MPISVTRKSIVPLLAGLWLMTAGCGDSTSFFNRSFINVLTGGVIPLTPGPGAAFILVRCVNDTSQPVEFAVTIERLVLALDENGDPQFDPLGRPVTFPVRESIRLRTFPNGRARELGTLFPCGESPVTLVGLGENLLPTDTAVFVGGEDVGGSSGFGVRAGNLNPLQLAAGNFNCGDTIIFRAFESTLVTGVALQSLILPGSEQPSVFQSLNTFVTLQEILESQARQEEP